MSLSYDFHASTQSDNGNVFQIVNNRRAAPPFLHNPNCEVAPPFALFKGWAGRDLNREVSPSQHYIQSASACTVAYRHHR